MVKLGNLGIHPLTLRHAVCHTYTSTTNTSINFDTQTHIFIHMYICINLCGFVCKHDALKSNISSIHTYVKPICGQTNSLSLTQMYIDTYMLRHLCKHTLHYVNTKLGLFVCMNIENILFISGTMTKFTISSKI